MPRPPTPMAPMVIRLLGAVAPSNPNALPGTSDGIATAPPATVTFLRNCRRVCAFMNQPGVQVLAVCDVQKHKRDRAAQKVNQKNANTDCGVYSDFREVLARPDIDAVLIATGDRWHAPAAIMAMRAGKDVYCEKPGAITIAEGQALVQAEKRYGRIFQTGAQRASEKNFVIAGELMRTGMLGEVKTVYAHLGYLPTFPRVNTILPGQPQPATDELDWDMWLGSAPWRDYHPDYLRPWPAPGWYTQPDFAAGIAQWGSHTILQCQLDLGLGDTAAVDYEFPDDLMNKGMTVHFANGVKLVATRHGWKGACGVRYEGTEGSVAAADGYSKPDVTSPALETEFDKLVQDYTVRHQRPLYHAQDFLNCVRSRRTPVTPATVAHHTMTTNLIMDMCLDLKRSLTWDPVKEEFIGDDEANRLRSRATRKSWTV